MKASRVMLGECAEGFPRDGYTIPQAAPAWLQAARGYRPGRWSRLPARSIFVRLMVWAVVLASYTGWSASLTRLWEIPADGSREYVNASPTERGLAYNPLTRRVFVASRAIGTQVAVLNSTNAAEVGFLDVTGVSGGVVALGHLGVAEDGRLYGANLSGSETVTPVLKIYRWDTESSPPVILFAGNPTPGINSRWGESFAVRGAGTNTQILMGGGGSSRSVVLFRYADPRQTNLYGVSIAVDGASPGAFGRSLAFGPSNVFFSSSPSTEEVLRVSFNLSSELAASGLLLSGMPLPTGGGPIGFNPSHARMAVIDTLAHLVKLYDLSIPQQPVLVGQTALPEPSSPNVNGTGQLVFGPGLLFALETQNGLLALDTVTSTGPPEILQQPADVDSLEGAPVSFQVIAAGAQPLRYQWEFDGTALTGATNPVLVVDPAEATAAGRYRVRVANQIGTNVSAEVQLNLGEVVRSAAISRGWTLAPGSRPYVPLGSSRPRLAVNPVTGSLLLLLPGLVNSLSVLNPTNGELIRNLSMAGDLGGPNPISLQSLAVAEDGAIYATSGTPDGTSNPVRLYRWADELAGTLPGLVFSGDPGSGVGASWGETLSGRGRGQGTQLLMTSRTGTNFALLTLSGTVWSAKRFSLPLAPGALGGGAAFGTGNTFWSKTFNSSLLQVEFDPAASRANVLRSLGVESYPTEVSAIALVAARGWIAGLNPELPSRVMIHELSGDPSPSWLDTEFFPASRVEGSDAGSVAASGDRIFAALSGAGMFGMPMGGGGQRPVLRAALEAGSIRLTWEGSFTLQRSTDAGGAWTDLANAQSGYIEAVAADTRHFFRLRGN